MRYLADLIRITNYRGLCTDLLPAGSWRKNKSYAGKRGVCVGFIHASVPDSQNRWTEEWRRLRVSAIVVTFIDWLRVVIRKKTSVSEVIGESDGSPAPYQKRRLKCCAGHFRGQYNISFHTCKRNNTQISVHQKWRLSKRDVFLIGISPLGPMGFGVILQGWWHFEHWSQQNSWVQSGEEGRIPVDWCESMVVPIYKGNDGYWCENHIGITLVSIAPKLHAGIIRSRSPRTCEERTIKNPSGFPLGRGCIDQISIRRPQKIDTSFTDTWPLFPVSLKMVLDLVHCAPRPTEGWVREINFTFLISIFEQPRLSSCLLWVQRNKMIFVSTAYSHSFFNFVFEVTMELGLL